jgi:hypothetical protein
LIKIKPIANDTLATRPIAASPFILSVVARYLIRMAASATNGIAMYKA